MSDHERFCRDCRHALAWHQALASHEMRCAHPKHGRDLVTGSPRLGWCAGTRQKAPKAESPDWCGPEGKWWEFASERYPIREVT